jgi:ribosomal protein L11 methylase PrmA
MPNEIGAPHELVVSWSTGEEEGVRLVVRSTDFEDVKQKAREFLALIREERLSYNERVIKPLLAKQQELQDRISQRAVELHELEEEIEERRLNGHAVTSEGETEH